MQRRASRRYGAGKAPVGQMSRQARQVPQWSSSGRSGGSSSVVKIAPRNSHEPCSRETRIRVLALPAEAGRFGERLLHHRRGVDEYLDVAAGVFDEPAPEAFEPLLDQLVVVVALGVDRYGAARARFQDRQRIIGRTVVDAEHHHRAHLGPQRARIAAPVGVLRHPFHVAMFAGGEEGA